MDPCSDPSPAMALCFGGEGSFSVRVGAAKNETKAEIKTAQALFNGQRMEKWEFSSLTHLGRGIWF